MSPTRVCARASIRLAMLTQPMSSTSPTPAHSMYRTGRTSRTRSAWVFTTTVWYPASCSILRALGTGHSSIRRSLSAWFCDTACSMVAPGASRANIEKLLECQLCMSRSSGPNGMGMKKHTSASVGRRKLAGRMPTMAYGVPSTRSSLPTTSAAPPKCSCHYASVRTATCACPSSVSASVKVRPSAACAPSRGKSDGVTRMLDTRSVLPASPTVLPVP
jgi:hypothetical protein